MATNPSKVSGNCVSVADMADDEYLENDATNPKTGENITNSGDLSNQKVCKGNYSKDQQSSYEPNGTAYVFDGYCYELQNNGCSSLASVTPEPPAEPETPVVVDPPAPSEPQIANIKCYSGLIEKTTFAPDTEFYCTIGLTIYNVDYEVSSNRYSASGYPKYQSNKVVLKYNGATNVTILAARSGYRIPSVSIRVASSGSSGSSSDGSSCLVKGTKIKTIDGYKNIEDIEYDDLLATWSYDLGEIVYEYPIWLEKESESDSYQETTFSDGTVLKTVGFHGIYSYDLNKFVSVDDKENFKVGTNVAKLEDGKLKKVTVTKIEQKSEKVNYYHVESTRYYNVIANDLLTTDGYVDLTNIYKFDSNVKWQGNSNIINDSKNLYSYKELKSYVPYYLYKGLRMNEAKYLEKNGVITKQLLVEILNNTMLNKNMTKKPITKDEKRYWMVTLSTDDLSGDKTNYLKKEGSIYKLPLRSNIKYWYNASDNKYYKPGSKVKVYHGMHFIAVEK